MLATVLIILAIAARLLPHAPNVAPIAALALFGGCLAALTLPWRCRDALGAVWRLFGCLDAALALT